MTKPNGLPPHLNSIWDETQESFSARIGPIGMEALCIQIYRMRDAQERISREGAVVADAKGAPAAHPALAVEKQAQAEIRQWVAKYGRA